MPKSVDIDLHDHANHPNNCESISQCLGRLSDVLNRGLLEIEGKLFHASPELRVEMDAALLGDLDLCRESCARWADRLGGGAHRPVA